MTIILLPLLLGFLVYPFLVIFTPEREEDRYFAFFGGLRDKDILLNYLRKLEEINGRSYQTQLKRIDTLMSKKWMTERDSMRIEIIIKQSYFNQFRNRWEAFRKADGFLKFLVLMCIALGAFLWWVVIYYSREDPPELTPGYLAFLIGFGCIPTFVFTVLLGSFYSMFFTILTIIFPNKGSIALRSIMMDEMIRALKPGGRDTDVDLPSGSPDDLD